MVPEVTEAAETATRAAADWSATEPQAAAAVTTACREVRERAGVATAQAGAVRVLVEAATAQVAAAMVMDASKPAARQSTRMG